MTVRYRAVVAYDGTDYRGFQRQVGDTPTIQRALELAIEAVTGCSAAVTPAGRTDTGVHATGQVIAFDVDWRHDDAALLRAINATLPGDIALQSIAQAPGFHPRFDAQTRRYGYTVVSADQRQPLLRRYAWHVWSALDLDAMRAGAALLVGEHDFATFGQSPTGGGTVRVIYRSEWTAEPAPYGARLVYTVEGNAFLQHMVRRIVGMLVAVGLGQQTVAAFAAAFRAANLAAAGPLAPPMGLVLEAVTYP